jgi:hypothetical protein
MTGDLPLRCRCGALEGRVGSPDRAGRAICYCRDCRSFARWLGEPERTLDAAGGTEVLATLPRFVAFDSGLERLQCVSLTPRGLYRWYAACCRTPIGNTPRDPKLSYVGLVRGCVDVSADALDAAVGPARMRVSTDSALERMPSTPRETLRGLVKVVRNVGGARLSGGYRENPFFRAGTARPLVAPTVLSFEQWESLREEH